MLLDDELAVSFTEFCAFEGFWHRKSDQECEQEFLQLRQTQGHHYDCEDSQGNKIEKVVVKDITRFRHGKGTRSSESFVRDEVLQGQKAQLVENDITAAVNRSRKVHGVRTSAEYPTDLLAGTPSERAPSEAQSSSAQRLGRVGTAMAANAQVAARLTGTKHGLDEAAGDTASQSQAPSKKTRKSGKNTSREYR